MEPLPRRLYAPTVPAYERWAFDRIVKATGGRVSPPAVLTYPIQDIDNDILEPAGIDWRLWEGALEVRRDSSDGEVVGRMYMEELFNDPQLPIESALARKRPMSGTE